MKLSIFFAGLVAVCLFFCSHAKSSEAEQLWLVMALGFFAGLASSIILWVVHEPLIRWPFGFPKFAISSFASLTLFPFASVAIGFLLLTFPIAFVLLPALFWRDQKNDHTHLESTSGHHGHGALIPQHA